MYADRFDLFVSAAPLTSVSLSKNFYDRLTADTPGSAVFLSGMLAEKIDICG